MAGDPNNPNPQPDPPQTDPPAKPDTGKPPANPQPSPQPQPGSPPAFLTADEADARFKALLAGERQAWEAEHVAKLERAFRDNFEIPKRRDSKISALRQELQGAGKYLPADDDVSDPGFPGDLAALADLDDSTPVPGAKSKDGKPLTRLDVELGRVRARLMKREAKRAGGDALGTPPIEPGGDDFLDKVADDARKERESKRSRPTLADVYGGFAPAARR